MNVRFNTRAQRYICSIKNVTLSEAALGAAAGGRGDGPSERQRKQREDGKGQGKNDHD